VSTLVKLFYVAFNQMFCSRSLPRGSFLERFADHLDAAASCETKVDYLGSLFLLAKGNVNGVTIY
jgi:hypothetical protein